MNRRRISLMVAALALALGAAWLALTPLSGPAPTIPAPPVASAAHPSPGHAARSRPDMRGRWHLGETLAYRLDSRRAVAITPRGGERQDIASTVAGLWITTVVARDPDRVLLRVVLRDPSVAAGDDRTAPPHAELAAMASQLATPFYVRLSGTGRVEAIHLRGDLDVFARATLQAIVAATQYVSSGSDALEWETEESDTTGMYASRYQRGPGGLVQKTNLGYIRIATAGGMVPLDQVGAIDSSAGSEFALGAHQRLEHVAGGDHLVVTTSEPSVTIESRSTWRLDLERVTTEVTRQDVPDFDAGGWESFALDQAGLAAGHRSDADRDLLRGAGFDDLLGELERALAAGDGRARAQSLRRWAALLRTRPEVADRLPRVIASHRDPAAGSVLIGAMESAGTGAAQRALRAVASSADAAHDNRVRAISALGGVTDPDLDTVASLRGHAAGGDEVLRDTATLALGAVVGSQGQNLDPRQTAALVDELVQRLAEARTPDRQALYLEALGNTRDPRAAAPIQAMIASRWPHVRGAAARALRFQRCPGIDQLLLSVLMADGEAQVRGAALFAFSFRPLTPLLGALRPFLAAEPEPGLRRDAVALVGSHLPELAAPGDVIAVLDWVARTDGDESVRVAARSYLGGA